ncbi:MFS transporter-like protein [Mollisia scopiformis]|uniref:MFS transporter-like protein n=1 Tax=Mollisia scopiformis TaxID=149040 RepID=A0A194XD17_MOLSC|nr:MFS transporter-like protein [Mollisia scopiformis]KUJ18070.1 MFS transporter-like protein [Mollisia scopiformis]
MGQFANFISGARVDPNSAPPYLLKIRSSKLFILSTICIAVFTDIFLYGAIVPVIPFAIQSRAGVEQSSVQSYVSILLACYGAALLVLSPVVGWYADRSSSRRFPLLIGLLALASATVMLCLARTVALLIVGRLLQGFSAAIVWVVGMALLVDTVGEKEIGETLGWVSISMSVGILLAPLLGGVVYNKAGYYAVYYMAFGLIGLDIILRLTLIEKKIARQWLDDEADTENMSDPEQGCQDSQNTEDEKPNVVEPSDGNTHESIPEPAASPTTIPKIRSKWPPVLTLLKSRRLLTALWGCIVQGSQMTAFDSVIPLYVQRTFHWNSIGAGLIFLAVFIPGFAAPLVGWATDKYGPRWPTVIGFTMAIPFWVLLRFVTYDSLGQKVLLCALLALIGVALCLTNPPLMAEITYVVEAKERQEPGRFGANGAYAQAYGLFITAFAAGTLIGPVWSGYVEQAAGWGTMSWSLGLFSISGAIPCFIWTGGLITQNNAKSAEERAAGRPQPVIPGAESNVV